MRAADEVADWGAAAGFGTETDERAVVSFMFHFAVSLLCNIIFVVLFRIKIITQKNLKKKRKQKMLIHLKSFNNNFALNTISSSREFH